MPTPEHTFILRELRRLEQRINGIESRLAMFDANLSDMRGVSPRVPDAPAMTPPPAAGLQHQVLMHPMPPAPPEPPVPARPRPAAKPRRKAPSKVGSPRSVQA